MTVTMESAFGTVHASAGRLREAARDLVLIAVEDQPRGTDVHLVTQVHDAALDVAAEAEQAEAVLAADPSAGVDRGVVVARAIAGCHARVNALGSVLVREMAAPERLGELAALGVEHGREAGAWANEIVRCIQTCQQLLWTDMQPALLGYWRELADTTNSARTPSEER
jgi:hypothetical protein